jgi:hypothetical protein
MVTPMEYQMGKDLGRRDQAVDGVPSGLPFHPVVSLERIISGAIREWGAGLRSHIPSAPGSALRPVPVSAVGFMGSELSANEMGPTLRK